MAGRGLILPTGTLPPLRGDLRDEIIPRQADSPTSPPNESSATSHISSPLPPSTSTGLVKHDEHIARVTSHAYSELARLSQVAAIATAMESSSLAKQKQRAPSTSSGSNASTMFIKASPRANRAMSGMELQMSLDRNRNLLKSPEVRRLLNAGQLEKLKQDTLELEKAAQAAREKMQTQELEHGMMELNVTDGSDFLADAPRRYNLVGTTSFPCPLA
jgi:hypothetical protein